MSIATAAQRESPSDQSDTAEEKTQNRWGIDNVSLSNYKLILSLVPYRLMFEYDKRTFGFLNSQTALS